MKRSASPPDPDANAEALDRLSDELPVLNDVPDEMRCERQWANQNRRESDAPVWAARRITSMLLYPAAPVWAERLSRLSAADLPTEDAAPRTAEPGQLF